MNLQDKTNVTGGNRDTKVAKKQRLIQSLSPFYNAPVGTTARQNQII